MATQMTTVRQREATEWVIAYWYNGDDNKLPRTLLIGDSICNGYGQLTSKELAGVAYVSFYASSKCVTDRTYRKQLAFMLEEYDYDVIHFNNGLHSLNMENGVWEKGLREALALIQEKGKGAKVIWASSTPVQNPEQIGKVRELNAVAESVMRELKIPVNDLFSLLPASELETYWADGVHFHEPGRILQAKKVAEVIRTSLGKKTL